MPLKPETIEQIKLFKWLRLNPKTKHCSFAIPNDGKRSVTMGAIMKQMGMRAGVSDLFIACPNSLYHGLFIELKAKDNRTGTYRVASPTQLEFISDMLKKGYEAVVCNGADDAIKIIGNYLA